MERASVHFCEPLRQRAVDSIASLRNACKTLRNDAVESAVRCRNGSRIARSRTPRAQLFLLYAWSARACDSRS
eukprot:9644381-Lingulodinium_polyedra.AAC.1